MEGCRLARYNSSYSMKRCPKCGSGAESTNKGERVFADVVGILLFDFRLFVVADPQYSKI